MSNRSINEDADAEQTVKFAIFDALAASYGKPPEARRDAIYESILNDDVVWALEEVLNNE